MKKAEKLTLAAIAVIMHLPMSSVEIKGIADEYGVDHREVMTEVDDMLKAEQVFETDMKGTEL